MGWYRDSKPISELTHTRSRPPWESRLKNTPPIGQLSSGCVKHFPKRSFVPVPPPWSPKKGNNIGQKKSTHVEISKSGTHGRSRKTRCVWVRSRSGLRSRYYPIGIPYMEKESVKKSQHIERYYHPNPEFGPI